MFVESPFPGVIGVGKVETASEFLGDRLMLGKLFSIIAGNRMGDLLQGLHQPEGHRRNLLSFLAPAMSDQGELGLSIYNGKQHSFVSFPDDGIDLPISDSSLLLHDPGSVLDSHSSGDLSPLIFRRGTSVILLVLMTQVSVEPAPLALFR